MSIMRLTVKRVSLFQKKKISKNGLSTVSLADSSIPLMINKHQVVETWDQLLHYNGFKKHDLVCYKYSYGEPHT